MKRRTLLAVTGAATISTISGCLGGDSDGDDLANNETDEQEDGMNDGQEKQLPFSDMFSATSQGGFLAIDEGVDSRSEAREAGFVLPDGEEVFTLEAVVADENTWESTAAEFPTLQIDDPITTDVSLELPNGLSGKIFEDRMTASGQIRVVIEETGDQFSFEIDATSEESGNLRGDTNFGGEPMTATLVDNEFVIEEGTGNILVDSFLGLPADEPGTNWFEIDLELTGN